MTTLWTREAPGRAALYIENHGQYQTDAESLDDMMARYLPASLVQLRTKVQEIGEYHGMEIDYSDLKSVTECLFILAELNGRGL